MEKVNQYLFEELMNELPIDFQITNDIVKGGGNVSE